MHFIGPHVSAAGAPAAAIANAQRVGATAFALFVKNQRQWIGKPLQEADVEAFDRALAASEYAPIHLLPHAGYLINLANPNPEAHEKSMRSMLDEMTRCAALGLVQINLHPGSHLKLISAEAGCDRVAESINTLFEKVEGVSIVLENTAGQGGCLGARFEELRRIYNGVEDKARLGFCLDTAHSYGAGFDLRTEAGYESFMADFDRIVGLHTLRGMHLNDSMVPLASHKDRHASLGKGEIGWGLFERIAHDPRTENIPLIIETPDETLWADEIAHLLHA